VQALRLYYNKTMRVIQDERIRMDALHIRHVHVELPLSTYRPQEDATICRRKQ